MPSLEQFEQGLAAWSAAKTGEDIARAVNLLKALWPSLSLRPNTASTQLHVHPENTGGAAALFYLNEYGKRGRDPRQVALAFAACAAMADAVTTAPRHLFEVYDSHTGHRVAFYPVDVADEATAQHTAHRAAAALNDGDDPPRYAVRELGRPVTIAAA